MDGGWRTRPRRRSSSKDFYRYRVMMPDGAAAFPRSSSSHRDGGWKRRRRSPSPFSQHEYYHDYKHDRRRRPRTSSSHDDDESYRSTKRRRTNVSRRRSPPDAATYRQQETVGSRRKEHRRNKPRRRRQRRRRSPTFPSPQQQHNRQAAGVVSVEDDVAVVPAGTAGPPSDYAPQDENNPKQARARSASSHDDTKGHFQGGEGTVIANRYRILRDVGLGTFGRVVEAIDLKRSRRSTSRRGAQGNDGGSRVAIKIVRNIKRYHDSAQIEADIVEHVNRRGGRGTALCATMFDAFTWKSHYCLVFESLGPSLYDYMKRHDHQPFPMICVRHFARQILEALEFLHSFGLIHTDLKPENILLCSNSSRDVTYKYRGRTFKLPETSRIKLIDFGGATFDHDKKKSNLINTRQYRAPEVILHLEWSMPSDLWSAGCVLMELYVGELLFATHDNLEHLALMEKCIGPFPRRMLSRAKKKSQLAAEAFDSRGRHRFDRVLPPESVSYVRKAVSLEAIIRGEDHLFLQMLRRLLVIDPDARASAHECLRYRL